MIREAIQEITRLSNEALRPHTFRPDSEPNHVYYLVENNGASRMEAEPPPRNHKVADLDSLRAMCERFAAEDCPVSVWYGRAGVFVYLCDEERRDKVALGVKQSKQMEQLAAWGGSLVWLDQVAIIRALRTVFSACTLNYGPAKPVIELFRRLKFRQSAQGERAIEHGKSSIGKQLEAEITGESVLPTDLDFLVPAFDGRQFGITVAVHALVEIDAGSERIAIVPEAGAIERAWCDAEEDLGRKIAEALSGVAHVSVYRGQP